MRTGCALLRGGGSGGFGLERLSSGLGTLRRAAGSTCPSECVCENVQTSDR